MFTQKRIMPSSLSSLLVYFKVSKMSLFGLIYKNEIVVRWENDQEKSQKNKHKLPTSPRNSTSEDMPKKEVEAGS